MNDRFPHPNELLRILTDDETSATAMAVYKEIKGYVNAYKKVQDAARDCIMSEMKVDGVISAKWDIGSAGWTIPKTPKLNKTKWMQVCQQDQRLAILQMAADEAQEALQDAQEKAGCFELPEGNFYIK